MKYVIYANIHIYIYTHYTYIWNKSHISVYLDICLLSSKVCKIYIYICVNTYVCMYLSIHAYIKHTHIHIYIYTRNEICNICIHIYIYIYSNKYVDGIQIFIYIYMHVYSAHETCGIKQNSAALQHTSV